MIYKVRVKIEGYEGPQFSDLIPTHCCEAATSYYVAFPKEVAGGEYYAGYFSQYDVEILRVATFDEAWSVQDSFPDNGLDGYEDRAYEALLGWKDRPSISDKSLAKLTRLISDLMQEAYDDGKEDE